MGKGFRKNDGGSWESELEPLTVLGYEASPKMQIPLVLVPFGLMRASGFAYPCRFVGPCWLKRSGDQNRRPALSLSHMPVSIKRPKEGAQRA